MKLGILTGYNDWEMYIESCKELKVDYTVVDILSPDWIQNIKNVRDDVDGFLCRPPLRADFRSTKTYTMSGCFS